MVTYQLDETAYSTGPASSTSHSSPKRPQLEKTVVSSVNSTHDSLRKSINLGKNDSSVSDVKGKNKTAGSKEEAEGALVLEKKPKVPEEQNISIDNIKENRNETRLSHHSKKTRSEGSSLREIHASGNAISRNASKANLTGERKQEIENVEDNDHNVEENHSSQNITKSVNESSSDDTVLKRRRGELRDPEDRQNDGTYEPMREMGCGAMTLILTREGEQTPLLGQDKTKYDIIDDDDNDKGIKKLRTILREAQRTIEKFQMDFKIDDSFRKNKPPLKLWERLQKEDFEEDDLSDTLSTNVNSSGRAIQNFKSENMNTTDGENSENSTRYGTDNLNDTNFDHRIRHQHHKSMRRKQHSLGESVKEEELSLGGSFKGAPASVKGSSLIVPTSSDTTSPTSPINSQETTTTPVSFTVTEDPTKNSSSLPTINEENSEVTKNKSSSLNVTVMEDTSSKSNIPPSRQSKKDHRQENETTTIKSTNTVT